MSDFTIPEEAVFEAWSEFRYPRAALDEPSEGFMRAIRALNTRIPLIVAAELDRLAREIDNAPYPYEVLERRAAELRSDAPPDLA